MRIKGVNWLIKGTNGAREGFHGQLDQPVHQEVVAATNRARPSIHARSTMSSAKGTLIVRSISVIMVEICLVSVLYKQG